MNSEGILVVAIKSKTHHSAELLGQSIANDGNDAYSPQGDKRECDAIISRNNIEVLRFVLDDVIYLCEVARCLLYCHNVLTLVGKTKRGFSSHVHTHTTWYIVKHHGEIACCSSGGNSFKVLIESLL